MRANCVLLQLRDHGRAIRVNVSLPVPPPVVIRKLVSFCCENRGDGARPFLSAPGVTPPRTSKKRTLGTGGTPFRHCSKGPPWFPPVPVPPIIISPGS